VRVPDARERTMVPLNVSLPLAAAAAGAAIAVGAASAIPRPAAPMTSVASCVPPVVGLVCSNHCHGLTRRAPEDMQAQNTTVGPTCRRRGASPCDVGCVNLQVVPDTLSHPAEGKAVQKR